MNIAEVEKGSFIYAAPAALSREFCDRILATFEADKAGQYVGATRRGDSQYQITVENLVDHDKPHWLAIDAQLYGILTPLFKEYVGLHFGLQEYALRDTGYIVVRYTAGAGLYKWHSDEADLHGPLRYRFSTIVYLNDVPSGGETEFMHQGVLVKPEAGKVLLFPSTWTHVHRGNMPISNDKYIITSLLFSSAK